MLAGSKITVTVRFFLSRILSWSKTTITGSKLSKGQNQVMTGNYFPWNTDCACSLLKLCFCRHLWSELWEDEWKMCWRFGIDYPPKKLRRSNVIAQSTLRGGHVYCIHEKVICSFTSTSLAHMVVETIARGTWSPFFFFFPWIPTIMLMIILAL